MRLPAVPSISVPGRPAKRPAGPAAPRLRAVRPDEAPPHAPDADRMGQLEYHAIVLLSLGLVAFGLIMVYSASSGTAVIAGTDPLAPMLKQAAYAVLGFGAMAVAARTSYQRLRPLVPVVTGVALVLLIAVMIPGIGAQINGARRWILIGPLSLQPSELSKLATLLFVAAVLASRRRPPRTVAELMNPVGGLVLVVCGLVVFEPDLGTAISIALMTSAMLLVAGTRLRLFMTSAVALAAAGAFMIYLEPYRQARLFAFLDPWHDAGGSGYQNVQALISLGSGGFTGAGIGNGTQKITYLPEAPTDMIFAVIGEELGLVGVLVTVLAFAAIAAIGLRIAMRATDRFGRLLAVGVTCLITGQAIVNFGAVLGFLPLTGVPLPLISSGGSSLVVFLAMIGVLLSVADAAPATARAAGRPRSATDAERPEATRPRKPAARADRRRGNGRPRRPGAGGGRRAVG
jgi:cell division protein FtsW